MHPESQRLADVLNRLGLNGMDGTRQWLTAEIDGKTATTPEGLIAGADGDAGIRWW